MKKEPSKLKKKWKRVHIIRINGEFYKVSPEYFREKVMKIR